MQINVVNVGIHTMINVWWEKLGVHWDDKKGCNISPEMKGVWDAHMQVRVGFHLSYQFIFIIYIDYQLNENLWPFKTSGWKFLKLMDQILPDVIP